MGWSYNGSVGYKGYASINGVRLLATGGQISLNQDPLASQGVWGAGYGNAAQIAWAYNYLRLEGNVSYDLTIPSNSESQVSANSSVWGAIGAFAFSNRTLGLPVNILPDGVNGYKGQGYCSQISFNAQEGAIVTGDVSFQGDAGSSNSGSGIITGKTIPENAIQGDYENLRGDLHLVPYWATGIRAADAVGGTSASDWRDIISWNASYNSDIQLLKCCKGQSRPPLGADYLVLGEMTGDGSFTVFTIAGDFSPASYQGKKDMTIYIARYTNRNGADDTEPAPYMGEGTYKLKIPCALIQSGSTAIQTGASYVTCDFNFTAYGDGTGAPVQMDPVPTSNNSNSVDNGD